MPLDAAPKFDALPLALPSKPDRQTLKLFAKFGDPSLTRAVLSVGGPVAMTELVPVDRQGARYVACPLGE